MTYSVHVDSNFQAMDREVRYTLGEFETLPEALAAARAVVDQCLEEVYEPGIDAAELYARYTLLGDDPFIVGAASLDFSAWAYALERAAELCPPALPATGTGD